MALKIKRYEKQDEAALFELIRSEGVEWQDYFCGFKLLGPYIAATNNSITYVAYDGDTLCGFVRARDDDGFGIYIYDLLVHQNYRGNSYGRILMEQIGGNFPGSAIYVASDADGYYEKLGYKKAGTVFTVKE